MPTNNTPPSKSQFGNYIALIIFGLLTTLAWTGYIGMTWVNRDAFHGTDALVVQLITIAPALLLSICTIAIRREIRKNQAANDDA